MKLFLMNMMMMMNFTFISLNHPMSMGLIILLQLILAIIIMTIYMKLPWFSYMLFLMFVGGMLILFMYMCSISSNNIMIISPKMIMWMFIFMTINLLMSMKMNLSMLINNKWLHTINYSLNDSIMDVNTNMIFLMKMFNNYSAYTIIFMIMYLFILMIMVNKITNLSMGPLRKIN